MGVDRSLWMGWQQHWKQRMLPNFCSIEEKFLLLRVIFLRSLCWQLSIIPFSSPREAWYTIDDRVITMGWMISIGPNHSPLSKISVEFSAGQYFSWHHRLKSCEITLQRSQILFIEPHEIKRIAENLSRKRIRAFITNSTSESADHLLPPVKQTCSHTVEPIPINN